MRYVILSLVIVILASPIDAAENGAATVTVAQRIDVEPVWSAHAVRFALLTHGQDQYVGYYDAERRMSIAHRRLDQTRWTIHKLPQVTGWDSHNAIAMAVDEAGCLHVAGDMHGSALRYFRMTRPGDVASLTKFTQMVGDREDRAVTYPVFIRLPDGHIAFRYRHGSSGSGDDIYNIYDAAAGQWRRLVDGPVVSGEGRMNAYCSTPTLGPDGWFHRVWVWRDTGDAATCHDLSYARSRDLVNWQSSAGRPIPLPITLATGDVVDPIPIRGGLINNNPQLSFDSRGRPLITYSKYDEAGHSQVYLARPRNGPRNGEGDAAGSSGSWVIRQLSDWTYRREFGGGGTLSGEGRIDLGTPTPVVSNGGRLAVDYSYPGGRGTFTVDETTLESIPAADLDAQPPQGYERLPIRSLPGAGTPMPALYVPASLLKVESDFEGMAKRFEVDSAAPRFPGPAGGGGYILTWETLAPNRDRPRPEPWPAASMLRVIQLAPTP